MNDDVKELQEQVEDLFAWREQYIRNMDFLFTAFNAYLMERDNLDEGVDKWFDKYLKSQEKD